MTASLLTFAATLALTLVIYWSAIFGTYGRSDDYIYVHDVRTDTLDSGLGAVWFNAGRPVPAFLYQWVLPRAEEVADLVLLRLVSALVVAAGAALCGVLAMAVVGSSGWLARVLAVGVAGVAVTTTAAPSAVTWGVMAGQMPAFGTAVAAGMCATWGRTPWRWAVVAALVLLSAFSYQHFAPIAFFSSALGTAALWARREGARLRDPVLVGLMVVGAIALNLVFVTWRSGDALDRISGPTASERFAWFTEEFLPRTVDLSVPWSPTTAYQSAAVVIVLLLLALVRGPRHLALPAVVVVCWLCAALVIVPGELWASYRLIAAAQLVLWVGAGCCAAVGINAAWERRAVLGAPLLVAAGVAVASAGVASHHRAVDYFAAPNEVDWETARCAMRQAEPVAAGTPLRQSYFEDSTSPLLSYDEYGIIGTSTPFAIQYEAWLALDSVDGPGQPGLDATGLPIVPPTDEPGDALVFTPDACARG
ncbi:hypothetical protein [uncultured Nocardioides sp.]|uniref:hypothetical protein n=1 Tax=uncultured Nocardioides sp. TaxID=198441 RepID=UPI00262A2B7E|nr:hypothetical protein [uncultured Nocardioides sp.]